MGVSAVTILLLLVCATCTSCCYSPQSQTIYENIKNAETKLQLMSVQQSDIIKQMEEKRKESMQFRNFILASSVQFIEQTKCDFTYLGRRETPAGECNCANANRDECVRFMGEFMMCLCLTREKRLVGDVERIRLLNINYNNTSL